MEVFKIIQIVLLGLLPSLAWLWLYLRRDRHPEPRRLLVMLFLIGFLVTPLVGWFELCLNNPIAGALNLQITPRSNLCAQLELPGLIGLSQNSLGGWLLFFIIVAFIEELTKFVVVRVTAIKSREFDEPVDTMVYLIVVALGFAASENVFAALNIAATNGTLNATGDVFLDGSVLTLLLLRSFGATLLHTLSAGVLGYFLAQGYFHIAGGSGRSRHYWLLKGLIAATLIHAAFNILINFSDSLNNTTLVFATLALLIIGLISVLADFKKLQRTIFAIR